MSYDFSYSCMFQKNKYLFLFIISGGIQYLIDIGIFALLLSFGFDYKVANILARSLTGISGFFLNGYFTFKTLQTSTRSAICIAFMKFLVLLGFQTLLSTFIISVASGLFEQGSGSLVAIKCGTEVIIAIASFFLQKKIFIYQSYST